MKNRIKPLMLLALLPFIGSAQQTIDSTKNNGQIDNINEFATIMTVPFIMPDSLILYTDIYLPLLSDCLTYTIIIDTNILGLPVKDSFDIELITKGTQIMMYDSLTPPDTLNTNPLKLKWNYYDKQNLVKNPNPFQMPLIFTRTPYDKTGEDAMALMTLLGNVSAMQDMRGRYSSEGVYMPMYSDSWSKKPYHPTWGHVLDRQTAISDPKHGNNHEDGYNSVRFMTGAYGQDTTMVWLKNKSLVYDINLDGDMDTITGIDRLLRVYDIDRDGTPDTFAVATGNIGTFGASALANTQYQEAAAHKIDTLEPGLKCLLPIVGTNEHYKYTGYQNGVFRDRIVTGWVKGQIFTGVEDDSADVPLYYKNLDVSYGNPVGVHNSLHTSWDYGNNNKFDAASEAIDHFTMWRPTPNDVAGYYPNSIGRGDMDASRAPVDATGEGVKNGAYSRYKNMEVPAYHLFGWWDIFVDGQIETNNLMRKYISPSNRSKQKMIIGPWAHQTIGSTTTGDQTYPDNVTSALGFDVSSTGDDTIPLTNLFGSEIVSWYRHNLNYSKGLGEPKVIIPESKKWQPGSGGFCGVDSIRIPSQDYIISFESFINFLSGYSDLPDISIEISLCNTGVPTTMSFPVPAGGSLLPGLDNAVKINPPKDKDFSNPDSVPPVRFYVAGDGLDNTAGNYWFSADSFPLVNDILWKKMYLHQNGTLDFTAPVSDEGYNIYVHDPDDPILTTGGANMIVRTPQDDRNSQGQMNLAYPNFAPYTMDRPGVIKFTSPAITLTNGFAGDTLSIIGFPVFKLYAKTNPGGVTNGPTDTDFFIRILDVFPDGRELFVVEGCVNARARNYARALVHGKYNNRDYHSNFPEDEPADGISDIPYSNINIGEIYEYEFKMMPLAYTWAKDHKLKILISSSNYTRYQVNPNLPLEDGDFFRRKPGDGRSYKYDGVDMAPRTAVQRVAFAPWYATGIDLPIYTPGVIAGNDEKSQKLILELDALVFPNPAIDNISVYMNRKGNYKLCLLNVMGQQVYRGKFSEQTTIDLKDVEGGMYFIRIDDLQDGTRIVKKVSVQ